ncbi:hypothetical protein PENTCL1PPCAC_26012 [Pristionchus entomophagus]|uniref:Uncharacterized protein n=1 Tax=Pristionchus entomophagus TaxID=358040 RepID=A0AAV5UBN2_9BILA|nr:hypothetical protein PENTCL1PPCAC_26012 [Pristionchus entomophagus]
MMDDDEVTAVATPTHSQELELLNGNTAQSTAEEGNGTGGVNGGGRETVENKENPELNRRVEELQVDEERAEQDGIIKALKEEHEQARRKYEEKIAGLKDTVAQQKARIVLVEERNRGDEGDAAKWRTYRKFSFFNGEESVGAP